MEYCLSVKNYEFTPFASSWMKLEDKPKGE